MKKYAVVMLAIVLSGCLKYQIDEIPQEVKDDEFIFDVPANFNWSPISGANINVTLKNAGKITYALDSTLLELYDEDGDLLDALTIYNGKVEFNIRIPKSMSVIKIKSPASNVSLEIDPNSAAVDLNIPDLSLLSFSRTDKDQDGLFDAFDTDPENAKVTVNINGNQSINGLKSAQAKSTTSASYVIFEDLWPMKGDYDFNDLVAKTEFSWERGKSNYIEEIEGICEVEFIGAGMGIGLGFELFELEGSHLVYLDDIIAGLENASEDNSVTNGFILFNKVQSVGKTQINFKISLKDKALKSFLCVPYLFRTNDYEHQVRPFGAPPTEGQRMSLFRAGNDSSPVSWSWKKGSKFKYPLDTDEAFYKSTDKFPWGLEFITKTKFKPSKEGNSIVREYPKFRPWVESSGKSYTDWYEMPE